LRDLPDTTMQDDALISIFRALGLFDPLSNQSFAEKSFVNETTTLVALLAVNGKNDEARKIAGSAQKEFDSATLSNQMVSALEGQVPSPWPP
jgi:hypothetical protein